MKLKICGMKFTENIQQVAALQPDYMGFIFYERSKRNFEGIIPALPKHIKKTGVFVNEPMEILVSLVAEYQLKAIQLHGDESLDYIKALRNLIGTNIEIIKVFSVGDNFDFMPLAAFEAQVDYFLFDTKGKERGGNGITFNWQLLEKYPFKTPFFLSGGIGLTEMEAIQNIKKTTLPVYAIDINSKFETEPGLKNINTLNEFKNKL